jgi:hypothetical protein
MPMLRTLNQDFFKVWSADMAYVLGYFAADGSMIKNGRGAHFIEFTSTDRILIDHVQKVTLSNHTVMERKRAENCKIAYRLQIGSKKWFQDLTRLGFTQHKSLNMKFPIIPEEYLGHFVRGYFDGDGCAYFKEHWAKDRQKYKWTFITLFTTGSLVFAEELHTILKNYNIKGGHISNKQKGGYDLVFSYYDSLALYRLMYHTSPISTLYLPRKREKIERAIQVLGLDK